MIFSIVLNAMSDLAIEETRRILQFSTDNGLSGENAYCIIFHDANSFEKAVEMASIIQAPKTTLVSIPGYRADSILSFLNKELDSCNLILFPGNCFGNELSTRLAYRLNARSANNILSLSLANGEAIIHKNIYSGNLNATYSIKGKRFVFTIDKSLKEAKAATCKGYNNSGIRCEELFVPDTNSQVIKKNNAAGNEIRESKVLIIIGRGVGNLDNSRNIIRMGKELGIPVLASRPVAMNGWIDSSLLVGVSGYMLSPMIAIVLGASGASAFYAGICNSTYIISVNNDESSPILKGSDLCIVGDCNEVFEKFYQALKKEQSQ